MNTMENSIMSLWQTMLQLHRTFKVVLIGTLLAVGLAACGGGSDSPASTSTAPGAPTIGTAVGGNAQATVSFTAPASNGGSAITGYTVTAAPGGVTATGSASPIAVTGLANGTSYTFTVVATNAVGNSVASAASSAVTPAIPTAPTTAAPAPAHAIVASVLTTAANDIAGTDFFPNWNQATLYTAINVGGVETAKYSNLNYEGIALAANNNFSTSANVHFDVWTPDVTSLGFSLISPGPQQFQVNSTLTLGAWNSVDIPLSSFTGVDTTNVFQLSFTGMTPNAGGTIFIQNIYFWGPGVVAPTAPGAPTNATATAGNTQATVSFTAPASNGGSPITGYTVTSTPAGGVDSNAGAMALTHTVTGLTNGTSYTFTVVATNVVGNSVASAASNPVTPALSGLVTSTASSWALGGTDAFNGATTSLVTTQPAGAAGGGQVNAAKLVAATAAQYFGSTFLTLVNQEFCTAAQPTITLEIYAPAAATVRLKAEQDGDLTKYVEMDQPVVAGWQTLTFNCTAPVTAGYTDATVYNKLSVLPGFSTTAASAGETWYWDKLTYTPTAAVTYVPPVAGANPTVKPATPTQLAANVISIIGTTYGDMAGVGVNPNWSQSTVTTQVTVQGDTFLKYANLNYQGMDLSPATGIDVSGKTNLHIDVWAETTTALDVFLISPGPIEQAYTLHPTTAGWNSFDIPLSNYTTPVKTNIFQFKFVGTPAGNTVFIDNLYFW
jgi:Fibronectin type III domain